MLRLLVFAFACFLTLPAAGQEWRQYASAARAGFDAAGLESARLLADSVGSAAVMVVQDGHVVAAWGDIERKFRLHSVRKSLVSALMGTAVADGVVDLDATLAELGIDDQTPLTDGEKRARVRHLMASHSGIFLPAAYAPEDQDDRPARGTYAPGEYWFYNNWDFNVTGEIYEALTGTDLYQSFDERIAHPIGMEDYHPGDGYRVFEPNLSRHPAQTFRMSTRDLARFGVLYANRGEWRGRRVLEEDWVEASTAAISDFGNGRGYGYMWWTYEPGNLGERFPFADRHAAYLARGTGGQGIAVIEELGLVVVHRGDTDNGRGVGGLGVWQLVDRILAARTGEPVSRPELTDVRVEELPNLKPDRLPRARELRAEEVRQWLGVFQGPGGMRIQIYPYREAAYVDFPGEGHAELFATEVEGEFTVKVVSGVRLVAEWGADGRVAAMTVFMGPRELRAVRVE